jgi:hypothetical protein
MADRQAWRPILFDCPRTGRKVQGLLAEEAFGPRQPHYQTITCIACAGTHFIDPVSAKVLGAPRDGAG